MTLENDLAVSLGFPFVKCNGWRLRVEDLASNALPRPGLKEKKGGSWSDNRCNYGVTGVTIEKSWLIYVNMDY